MYESLATGPYRRVYKIIVFRGHVARKQKTHYLNLRRLRSQKLKHTLSTELQENSLELQKRKFAMRCGFYARRVCRFRADCKRAKRVEGIVGMRAKSVAPTDLGDGVCAGAGGEAEMQRWLGQTITVAMAGQQSKRRCIRIWDMFGKADTSDITRWQTVSYQQLTR